MNIFIFYLTICSSGVLLSGVYGKRIHTANSFYYRKPSYGDIVKKIYDIYEEDKNMDSPTENKHLFKVNVGVPKKTSNFDGKETNFRRRPYLYNNRRKSLSSEIGKHVIKVTSALQSQDVEVKQSKDGGYETSVNPKYSHVIEILSKEKKNIGKPELENSKVSEKSDQKTHTEAVEEYVDEEVETESEDYAEEEETESEDYAEEEVETESDYYTEEEVEAESDYYTEEGVETESEDYIEEEVVTESEDYAEEEDETESDYYTEEIETESEDYSEEVETESKPYSEEMVKADGETFAKEEMDTEEINQISLSTEADIEQLSGNDNESSFNSEFEGSGEDAFRSDDSEDDTSKSGRLLSIFARQNATAPNCTTPKGEPGHCKRIRQCILSDALNNFNNFLQQLCLIRGAMVGICCPDNPVIEISDPDDNNTVSINETDIKQPPEGCGLNVKTRIVGGSISVPHEWTWMVALLRRNRFYCGGVIINNWYILTAAHCVMGMNVKDLSVRLGEYDFNTHNKHQEDISVSEIKRHAQFVSLTFQHDIALLKLKRSIQYSKFVGSICLPETKARDYSDVQGTVVGWGTVSFGGAASPILRQVTVPVWKNEDCDRTYSLENINDAFMCAGSPEKGEDACQGDSGGPLMAVNDRGRWEVIGLVSWGRRCGDPTYPGVYTRVTTYLDWIKENIN